MENVTKTVEVLQNLVKELSLTIKENNDVHTAKIEELESKVKKLLENNENREEGNTSTMFYSKQSELNRHMKSTHSKVLAIKKCNICNETFTENFKLEIHLRTHNEAETFGCDICAKTFVLKWRLRKHKSVHETTRYCHYFNNAKLCPFEELGCKFLHEWSEACKVKKCTNSLCQFTHNEKNPEKEKEKITESEIPDTIRIEFNDCDNKFTNDEDSKEFPLDMDDLCDRILERSENRFNGDDEEFLSDSFLDDIIREREKQAKDADNDVFQLGPGRAASAHF